MKRRQAREKALQYLFQLNFTDSIKNVSEEMYNQNVYFDSVTKGVIENQLEIDETIKNHLQNWKFERIGSIEKTVLRIAVYEILFMKDIPNGVAINEAVELAKTFGEDHSGTFVNGILSNIIKSEGN
ncbi:MAG TPA: transcription antitermination factor NusB [Bacillota bacterium]|nr:transcription antitermination factor NusB [Bacillota bacterium]